MKMKTGSLAKVIGYSRTTIQDWIATGLFHEFLSTDAKRESSPDFDSEDQMVFQTIAFYRRKGRTDFEDIADHLRKGERQEFRQEAAIDIAEDAANSFAHALAYKTKANELEDALARLKAMYDEKDAKLLEANRELGAKGYEINMLKEQIKKLEDEKANLLNKLNDDETQE